MKGIVFNLLEELIRRKHGEDTWDTLLESAGLGGAYTSLGSYADDEMSRLVEAASVVLQQPPGTVLQWFGRNALPLLAPLFGIWSDRIPRRASVKWQACLGYSLRTRLLVLSRRFGRLEVVDLLAMPC